VRGDHRLLAGRRHDRQLYLSRLNVEDTRRRRSLGEGAGTSREPDDAPRHAGRIKKFLHIERRAAVRPPPVSCGHDRSSHYPRLPNSSLGFGGCLR
jgi:hypothetical protein